MTTGQMPFRDCHRHRGKPALRDCLRCGKPICKQCELESGDPGYCAPCKEALTEEEKHLHGIKRKPSVRNKEKLIPAVPPTKEDIGPSGEPEPSITPPPKRSRLDVGELTVHEDGSIEEFRPPADKPAKAPGTRGGVKPAVGGEPGLTTSPSADSATPFPAPEKPVAVASPAHVEMSPTAPPAVPGKEKAKTLGLERRSILRTMGSLLKSRSESRIGLSKRIGQRFPATGTVRQILFAFPFGFLAGVAVYGAWLLLAYLRTQWIQTAVITAGIAVPWALFKGSTIKKKRGVRVYDVAPASLWLSLVSGATMIALTLVAEYFAFSIVYRNATSAIGPPFPDFLAKYFKPLDTLQVVIGLLLAFSIPFFLKAGERWKLPRIRKEEGKED